MADLTAKKRNALPKKDFAVKGKKAAEAGGHGKAKGSYPIPDKAHARNALARASGKPVEAKVRAAVHKKYPDIGKPTKTK
ncbi:hypothetical protein ABZ543_13055 [Streptomyces roseifaciens]